MSLNNFLSSRMMVGAAIVGIVGAAGVFIYEQVYAEKRRAMLVREMARLDRQITTMRSELEALRELQKEAQQRRERQQKRRVRRAKNVVNANASGDAADVTDAQEKSYASDSEYFTDYQSVAGTDMDMDSEEFYDVHTDDDEDDTLREPLRNGHDTGLELDEDLSEKADKVNSTNKVAT